MNELAIRDTCRAYASKGVPQKFGSAGGPHSRLVVLPPGRTSWRGPPGTRGGDTPHPSSRARSTAAEARIRGGATLLTKLPIAARAALGLMAEETLTGIDAPPAVGLKPSALANIAPLDAAPKVNRDAFVASAVNGPKVVTVPIVVSGNATLGRA